MLWARLYERVLDLAIVVPHEEGETLSHSLPEAQYLSCSMTTEAEHELWRS